MSGSEEDTEIATTESGAAATEPIRAGEVKKGMTVMLKGMPCKVIEITTSKTGKHGHAKANMTGLDIFTGKKYMDISPTSHNMVKPVVSTKSYTYLDVDDDGFASLMDDGGNMKEDVLLPNVNSPNPKLGEDIATAHANDEEVTVVVTSAMGKEAITNMKSNSDAD